MDAVPEGDRRGVPGADRAVGRARRRAPRRPRRQDHRRVPGVHHALRDVRVLPRQCSPTTYAAIPVPAANFMRPRPDPTSRPEGADELNEAVQEVQGRRAEPGQGDARVQGAAEGPRRVVRGHRQRAVLHEAGRGADEGRRAAGEGRLDAHGAAARRQPGVLAAAVAPLAAQGTRPSRPSTTAGWTSDDQRSSTTVDLRWGKSVGAVQPTLGMLLDTSVVRPGEPRRRGRGVRRPVGRVRQPVRRPSAVDRHRPDRLRGPRPDRRPACPLVLGAIPGRALLADR